MKLNIFNLGSITIYWSSPGGYHERLRFRSKKHATKCVNKGICKVCGKKVRELSPYNEGQLYRKCKKCRERENYLTKLRRDEKIQN